MGKKPAYFDEAEDLYVVDGLTLEAIAARLPVSVTTLSRWKQDGEWDGRRRDLAQSLAEIKKDTLLLRQKLIKKALEKLDPQVIYALARLETALGKAKEGAPEGGVEPETRVIKTPQDAVLVLDEVMQRKLNAMLTQPQLLTLAGIKDLKQCLEMVEGLKAKYLPGDEGRGTPGLSDEAAEEIRRQILGIA